MEYYDFYMLSQVYSLKSFKVANLHSREGILIITAYQTLMIVIDALTIAGGLGRNFTAVF